MLCFEAFGLSKRLCFCLIFRYMKRFRKIYIEITNVCNLNCSFCPGTKRRKHFVDPESFRKVLSAVHPYTDFVYLHLMGEPLIHPDLPLFLEIAHIEGIKVIITTNGIMLRQQQTMLLNSPALHKVNISLHSFEANNSSVSFDNYLHSCFHFGKTAEGKKIVVYRLWNQGGLDTKNEIILQEMETFFPRPWLVSPKGTAIGNHVFLEYGDKFEWPDLTATERDDRFFCYGLRDQLGILCDGTVVPCCLDHEGDIPLGNIFENSLDDIITSPRATQIYNGFSDGNASEPLCRRCGYANRF